MAMPVDVEARPQAPAPTNRRALIRMSGRLSGVTLFGPMASMVATATYLAVVPRAELATLELSIATVSIGAVAATFGLDQVLAAKVAGRTEEERDRVVSTCVYGILVVGTVLGILLVSFRQPFMTMLIRSRSSGSWVPLAALQFVATALVPICAIALRLRPGRAVVWFGMIGAALSLTAASLIAFVVPRTAFSVLAVLVATSSATAVVGLGLLRPRLHGLGRESIRLLSRGATMLPGSIGFIGVAYADRFFLVRTVSSGALADYGAANRLAGLVAIAVGMVFAAWWTVALRSADRDGTVPGFGPAFASMTALGAIVSLAAATAFPQLSRLLGQDKFHGSVVSAIWLTVFTGPAQVAAMAAAVPLQARGDLRSLARTGVLAVIVNLALAAALIHRLGVTGAVIATLSSGLVMAAANLYSVGRSGWTDIPWRPLIFTLAAYLIAITLLAQPAGLGFVARLVALPVVTGVAWAVGLLRPFRLPRFVRIPQLLRREIP
jgi:O-antigen/teichoic acid export membrane protein